MILVARSKESSGQYDKQVASDIAVLLVTFTPVPLLFLL